MLSPDRVPNLEPLAHAAADYAVVRRAIAFLSEHWRAQPEVEAIAEAAGVSATDLHHLFRRWAGITPKAFLQALTLDHARRLLRDSASVLDATFEVGDGRPLAGSRADGVVGALGIEPVDLGVHADRNGRERALQQASHEVRALVAPAAGERELLLAVTARGGDHRPV